MEQTDDIDIILTLNSHGWSTCFLFIKDKTIEFAITHIFNDPYLDLIKALSDLINRHDSVTLFWYDEPGGQKIEINRIMTQQHKVIISVNEFKELFDKEPQEYELKINFEIKLKQLVALFYLQLKKTHFLLQDKQFAENRTKDFPFQEFHKFEQLVKPYLGL